MREGTGVGVGVLRALDLDFDEAERTVARVAAEREAGSGS